MNPYAYGMSFPMSMPPPMSGTAPVVVNLNQGASPINAGASPSGTSAEPDEALRKPQVVLLFCLVVSTLLTYYVFKRRPGWIQKREPGQSRLLETDCDKMLLGVGWVLVALAIASAPVLIDLAHHALPLLTSRGTEQMVLPQVAAARAAPPWQWH
jgi:hypothetical protein